MDGSAHVLVTDNYYSSEKLAVTLNERGIGFVGTLQSNMSSFALTSLLRAHGRGRPVSGAGLGPRARHMYVWREREGILNI